MYYRLAADYVELLLDRVITRTDTERNTPIWTKRYDGRLIFCNIDMSMPDIISLQTQMQMLHHCLQTQMQMLHDDGYQNDDYYDYFDDYYDYYDDS
jgi:hypothetical protein